MASAALTRNQISHVGTVPPLQMRKQMLKRPVLAPWSVGCPQSSAVPTPGLDRGRQGLDLKPCKAVRRAINKYP